MSLTKVNADFMLTGRLSGQTISVDTTITTTAYIEQNNPVTISNGVTLSINGPFEAGLYQVFNCVGTGQVVFGNQVGVICPEWWATNTTPGTTNMQPALQAALTAAGQTNTTARTIKLNALYAVTDELVWSAGGYANNIHLQGVGSDKTGTYGTRIVWTGAVDATKTLIRVSENASFGRISNLQLDGASKIGFNLRFKAATDVQLGAPGWVFDRLVCENVTVANIVYGPYLDGGTYDVDAPDHIYYNLWLGDATLGLIIDAKNVQQLALYNPNFSLGDASVPISCVWQRNVESGPLLIVNPFINNMTNAHPATAMVQNSGGPLTIIGQRLGR